MRWWTLAIVAFSAMVIETSLRQAFRLGEVSPGAVVCVAVFVSLFAPKRTVLWSCWVMGLLIDAVTAYAQEGREPLHLFGPHAMGYTVMAAFMLLVRGSVFRQRVLTISVLTFAGVIIEGVVALVILLIRSWYPSSSGTAFFLGSSVWSVMLHLCATALYSAVLALPVGWLLLATLPVWRFETFGHRYVWR